MASIYRYVSVSGQSFGAMVVYGGRESETTTIHALDANNRKGQPFYAQVKTYQADDGRSVKASIFPTLPPANYLVHRPGFQYSGDKRVTVFPGAIAEVQYA